eukprot:Gb_21789 [translate_table: standard]
MDRGGNRGRGRAGGRGKGKGTGRGRDQRQGSEDVRRQSEVTGTPEQNRPSPSPSPSGEGSEVSGKINREVAEEEEQQLRPAESSQTEFENQVSGEYQVGISSSGGGVSRDKHPMPSESTSSEDMLWVRELEIKSPEESTSYEGTCSEEAVSSDDFSPMLRPDAGGKQGKMMRLIANHFLASFQEAQYIFHYDVEITQSASSSNSGGQGQSKNRKASVSKEDAQQIKNKLVEENRAAFRNAMPVYDGKKNLYSPVGLPEGLFTVKLSKGEDRKVEEEYTVALKLAKQLDGRRLAEFFNTVQSNHTKIQQEYVQALDLVIRENPSRSRIMIGRSLYSKQQEGDGHLGRGVVESGGFFQSLRPTAQGLALNVDLSVVAFHKSIGVIDYLRERCSVDCRKSQPWSDEEYRREALSAVRGLKIRVTHRLTTQKFAISGFTKEKPKDLEFEKCDNNGHKKTISVARYFKEHYHLDIRFKDLPCLNLSKTPERPNYVPMEFCQICEGQRSPRDHLTVRQSKELSMIACPPANDRLQRINDIMVRKDGPRGGPFARQFQITVGANMTEVTGRVLEAPKLKLGDGGRVREVTPRQDDRQWNLNNSHVFDGKHIDKWGLIYFSLQRPSWQEIKCLDNFVNSLTGRCRELGIHLNGDPVVREADHGLNMFSTVTDIHRVLLNLKAKAGSNLQILICVMRKRHPEKGKFKLVCETDIGLVTQCCLYECVIKCSDSTKFGSQYLANLALKINAKVGGSNAALLTRQIPRFGNSQVIYFGADVSHPSPGDKNSPSVAAVVASINWPWCNRYVARIRYQKHRQENIEQLGEMSKELLKEYLKVNRQLPQKIIFFRDGVSESQFYMVLHKELQSLKKEFSEFSGYNPTISFIVAQKRHHTRLFPCQGQPRTKSGNVMPGTVVDTTIVHPREFDFFLCSHYGIKGTSKPTHYHVVWDENSFTSDELQTLINNLCYTFARCTNPVSLVPPVYYADLAAYRGRDYVEALASETASSSSGGASTTSTPLNFPDLHKAVENSMFFC